MSVSTPTAAAIPIDKICESLAHHGFSDSDSHALRDDPIFQGLSWRCHQIYHVEL
jgi:hypothetical protein